MDDADTNRKFAESVEADYPILSDPDKKVATAYGVVGADRPMAQRWTFYIGPDGKIVEIDKKVNVRTAGADVVANLERLGVKKKK